MIKSRPGPGPGSYLLPSTIGYYNHGPQRKREPCYSIGRRLNSKDNSDVFCELKLREMQLMNSSKVESSMKRKLAISPNKSETQEKVPKATSSRLKPPKAEIGISIGQIVDATYMGKRMLRFRPNNKFKDIIGEMLFGLMKSFQINEKCGVLPN